MKNTGQSSNVIDEYIQRFPEEMRKRLQLVREAIRSKAPGAAECICYGIPTFKEPRPFRRLEGAHRLLSLSFGYQGVSEGAGSL